MAARTSARERLLTTADRLFYADGVHAVGIDRLIAEAGVAKGSLFYNFSGKEELVAAYLERRGQQRRERIAAQQEGRTDPVDRVLAVFDALAQSVVSPTYNGCPFANAQAEAPPDGVEAKALRDFRGWLRGMLRDLSDQARFTDPDDVADRLQVLYDGAIATSHQDRRPDAVRLAREMASHLLQTAPRHPDPDAS